MSSIHIKFGNSSPQYEVIEANLSKQLGLTVKVVDIESDELGSQQEEDPSIMIANFTIEGFKNFEVFTLSKYSVHLHGRGVIFNWARVPYFTYSIAKSLQKMGGEIQKELEFPSWANLKWDDPEIPTWARLKPIDN